MVTSASGSDQSTGRMRKPRIGSSAPPPARTESVMVGGPKIRVAKAMEAFAGVANASGYPFAVMLSAMGLVLEHHPPTAAAP